ncbi:TIGR03643 family protein [Oculatella sp. LEGE 06141]|uniref:TIGR03643 family protein n=1 Tax=Oculatella sp. LEGE 06141 TaxID=1828648 RepID=UPI00187E278A|nr:TIGR03643 family protein [Oculatella sp. LEGE 06141]MBE9179864.1 TIGR03643 family protein [Oculatella sp. LEGE 06141]
MNSADLDSETIDRVIEMAWEDRTPFEAIALQFGLLEKEVIALMRREMKPSSFRMWRKRVSGRQTKHLQKREFVAGRFKSQNQKT